MTRVIRSPEAVADLDAIWDYIAQDNVSAADSLLDRLASCCSLLAQQPEMGQARPELAAGLRSFGVGNYVLFYRAAPDGVELIRVIHAARDVDALF